MAWKYYPSKGANFKQEKAQIYGTRIQGVIDNNGGHATTQMIVDVARDEKDPLHEEFQWKDPIAAEAHRRNQARRLLQSIIVRIKGEDVRAFENIIVHEITDPNEPTETHPVHVYLAQDVVRKDKDFHEINLKMVLKELLHFRDRYRSIKGIGPIVKAIDDLEDELGLDLDDD